MTNPEPEKKRIILTGGGSAGHVTPNLALIPKLSERGFEIHYVGRKSGIEKDLLNKIEIPYYGINAGKLRRYFDLRNLSDIFFVGAGFLESLFLVRKLRPQVVFSKGGFVSCPLVWAAWLNQVPVIIHESDLTPGLANKLSAPFAKWICYSFPETGTVLPPERAVFTGIPIRESLLHGKAERGRGYCGFTDSKPVVLVLGGSQGAETINRNVRAGLDRILRDFNLCHICGTGGIEANQDMRSGYMQYEYADDELPDLLAMADVVVTRAGATTIFELLELRKPNLLIPLTLEQSRGDQIMNARSFEQRGFSKVLMEDDLSAESLMAAVKKIYVDQQSMILAMESSESANGTARVVDEIIKLAGNDYR
jgi:UDP-N-acetylglucosamine--N-acetylmuramyl-(pentapeptide) pyrophosphoryl-undecaprenol N-acetylglucosamine transferase